MELVEGCNLDMGSRDCIYIVKTLSHEKIGVGTPVESDTIDTSV